jgi:hypothetical protein
VAGRTAGRRVFVVLLVVSVGVNAWFLSRRHGSETKRGQQAASEEVRRSEGQPPGGAEEHVVGERRDLLGSVERDWLRRAGFTAPAESLRADLLRHPELVPTEGVVGGTMAFRPDAIYLLPGGHVWAIADDGHIETAILLRYSVQRDTTVRWSVVYHRAP